MKGGEIMIDYEKLLEDSDMLNVLEYFGEEYITKGDKLYMRCPEHFKRLGREDGTIGNCIVSGNRYYCFSCGANGDVLNYVKAKNNDKLGGSIRLLAKINGYSIKRYSFDDNNSNDHDINRDAFPLTAADIQLLNLYKTTYGAIPDNILYLKDECQDDREILPKIHYYSYRNCQKENLEIAYESGYLLKKSLMGLYESDKESFDMLIKNKIKEAQAETVACLDNNVISKFFKNKYFVIKAERELRKNLKDLNKLAQKMGIPEVSEKND